MKHDFRSDKLSEKADAFRVWLTSETVSNLRRDCNDALELKTSVFLYSNRACEAYMEDKELACIFGTCVAKAGLNKQQESLSYDYLEMFVQLARKINSI